MVWIELIRFTNRLLKPKFNFNDLKLTAISFGIIPHFMCYLKIIEITSSATLSDEGVIRKW